MVLHSGAARRIALQMAPAEVIFCVDAEGLAPNATTTVSRGWAWATRAATSSASSPSPSESTMATR